MDMVEISETIIIPRDWMQQKNLHVLQVKGDFPEADNLRDGDYVIVEKRDAVKDNELVLVRVRDGEWKLGRSDAPSAGTGIERTRPTGEAAVGDAAEVTIRGVVVGILRKYRD